MDARATGRGRRRGATVDDRAGVAGRALTRLFRALAGDIRVVVLNACYSACYSQPQAEAIAEHVDCVMGMRRAIGDRAAIRFAASFYRALAFGCSIANAFEQGEAQGLTSPFFRAFSCPSTAPDRPAQPRLLSADISDA